MTSAEGLMRPRGRGAYTYTAGILAIVRTVSLRHIGSHRRRTVLALIGLAAGVSLAIAITTVNATLKRSILEEARGVAGTAMFQVIPSGTTPLGEQALRAVRSTPGVHAAVPVLTVISAVRHDGVTVRPVIYGVTANLGELRGEGFEAVGREIAAVRQRNEILLTRALAVSLQVHEGELVDLETPHGDTPARVRALVERGPLTAINGGFVGVMALPDAQRVFDQEGEIGGIFVSGEHTSRQSLRSALERSLGPGMAVVNPGGEGKAYQRTFSLIATASEDARNIGLLVAFFLLLNTMGMAVSERRREIVLLAAAGASRGQILLSFLVEAAILGVVASAVGVLAGALLAHLAMQQAIGDFSVLPVTAGGPLALSRREVLFALSGGTSVAVLGAFLSARSILVASPIDGLRPEAPYEWDTRRVRSHAHGYACAGAFTMAACAALALLLPTGSGALVSGIVFGGTIVGGALLLPLLVPVLTSVCGRVARQVFGDVGRLATDALSRAPGRTMLTVGGMALAAALTIAIATSIGSYRQAINEAAAVWYQAPLYVTPRGSTTYVTNQPMRPPVGLRLERVPGVRSVLPMTYGIISAGGEQTIVYAIPVVQAAEAGERITGNLGIPQAALVRTLSRGEIVISRLTARRHHLKIGDSVPFVSRGHTLQLRIGGIFDDITSLDTVGVDHARYVQLTGDRRVDRYVIALSHGANADSVKRRLQRALDSGGVPAEVLTRRQLADNLVGSIASLFSVAQAVQVAALFIAILIVLSTTLTSIFERRRELGISRMLGMSPRQLRGSVVIEAASISFVASVLALALGLLLGFLITLALESQIAWRIAFRPSLPFVLVVALVSVVTGGLAAIYPGSLIARQGVWSLLRVT